MSCCSLIIFPHYSQNINILLEFAFSQDHKFPNIWLLLSVFFIFSLNYHSFIIIFISSFTTLILLFCFSAKYSRLFYFLFSTLSKILLLSTKYCYSRCRFFFCWCLVLGCVSEFLKATGFYTLSLWVFSERMFFKEAIGSPASVFDQENTTLSQLKTVTQERKQTLKLANPSCLSNAYHFSSTADCFYRKRRKNVLSHFY